MYLEYSSPPPHRPFKPLRNLRRMGCQFASLRNGGFSQHGRPRRPRLFPHQLFLVRLLPPETRDLASNRHLKPLDQIPSALHKNASTPLTSPLRNLHRRSQRGRTCPATQSLTFLFLLGTALSFPPYKSPYIRDRAHLHFVISSHRTRLPPI